ncbi:MAG: hypothetical protein DMF94_04740 [Acidobacteria bacterium]|nr:MAG: hypothetical protein DMF94_04740 [Acidobacteriota bacterium]
MPIGGRWVPMLEFSKSTNRKAAAGTPVVAGAHARGEASRWFAISDSPARSAQRARRANRRSAVGIHLAMDFVDEAGLRSDANQFAESRATQVR